MQRPPLDPDVAAEAPYDPVLTDYDDVHAITYFACLTRTTKAQPGEKLRVLCCILIPILRQLAPSPMSIWPVVLRDP